MQDGYGDADADFLSLCPGFDPGYVAYVESLGSLRDNPSLLILAAGEPAVVAIVRACGAVLGPVFHLADPDHASIRAAMARLEPAGPVLAITGERLWLTLAGEIGSCPFCRAFGPAGADGWSAGACPVIGGSAPARPGLLTREVLAALHVLIEDGQETFRKPAAAAAGGYSIGPAGPMPGQHAAFKRAAALAEICLYRDHARSSGC